MNNTDMTYPYIHPGGPHAALVHAVLCIPLCIWTYNYPTLRNDKVFGYDPTLGSVIAFSYG